MMDAAFAKRPSDEPMEIVVADDHALVRNGLKMLVSEVVGQAHLLEACDGDSLLRVVCAHPAIRLAVVDLKMPRMEEGFRLVELARLHPLIPVVVVSALSSPDVVRRTLNVASVHAFVQKSASVGRLRSAIEAALQGQKLAFVELESDSARPAITLTPRRDQIRGLLRQGLSNKMIAGMLGISEGTVKNHITEIFKALNATNRTQAAQINSDAV
jgi:DNA-binding NarL/FixJ family response regulator